MKRRSSVITRLSLLLTLLASAIMLALMFTVNDALKTFHESSARADHEHMATLIRKQLEDDAKLLFKSLSTALAAPLLAHDQRHIQTLIQHLEQYRTFRYLYIYDANGRIIHDGNAQSDRVGKQVQNFLAGNYTGLNEEIHWNGNLVQIAMPIQSSGQAIGAVAAGVDFSQPLSGFEQQANALMTEQSRNLGTVRWAILLTFLLLLPVCMACAYWLTRRMLRPLNLLTERSIRYAEGERDLSFELGRPDELGRLGSALEKMRQGLEESHEQVKQIAYEDAVTRLPNRRWFQQKLNEILHRSASINGRFAVLFIDLDHFKQVNDTAGHERGDQLLREVSRRLQAALEQYHQVSRSHQQPQLARLGGDEFVVLLPSVDLADDAAEAARAIAQALAKPFLLTNQYFTISCSIGITLYPDDGVSSSEILKHADVAMYSAKQQGRNQHTFFQPQMTEEISERLHIHQGMREAIAQNHLFLDYQPIYDFATGQITGAEALLRWHHPEHGLLSPARFIPIIEESDLIEDVTRWVASRAARDLLQLLEITPEFSVAINISGAALHQQALCEYICDLKQTLALPDQSFSIEVTETSMVKHLESCEWALRRWKEAGIEIWIDDFGTGYSSLAYLNSLAFDGLKIDRSFVFNLVDGNSRPLIDAMSALARSLQIKTIAEGIETEQQHQQLKRMGINYGQGFGLGRPMPLEQLMALMNERVDA